MMPVIQENESDSLVELVGRHGITPAERNRQAWIEHFDAHHADLRVLEANLLDIKKTLDEFGVPFFLAQGTLLAAVRDGRFFEHSRDVDLYMLWDDRHRLVDALPSLIAEGFDLTRLIDKNGFKKITFERNGEIVDLNILLPRRRLFCKQLTAHRNAHRVAEFFEPSEVDFLGTTFLAPGDFRRYLYRRYGRNWKQPVIKIGGVSTFRKLFQEHNDNRILVSIDFPFWPLKKLQGAPLQVSAPHGRYHQGSMVVFASGVRPCLRVVRQTREDGSVRVHGSSGQSSTRWWPKDTVLATAHTVYLGPIELSLHNPGTSRFFRFAFAVSSAAARWVSVVRRFLP